MGRRNANYTDFVDCIMFYVLFIISCVGGVVFYFAQKSKGYGIFVNDFNPT